MRGMIGTLLLAFGLISCAADLPEEEPEQEPEVVQEEPPAEDRGTSPSDDGNGVCDLYGTTYAEIDGKRIPIPVECESFYVDKGDPPPDQPNPGKIFVNEI